MSDAVLSRRAALVKLGLVGFGAYAAPALLNLSTAEARGGKSKAKKTKPKKSGGGHQGKAGNCGGGGGQGK